MPSKKIWEFPENFDPQPSMVFLVDENFITQKISLSGLTNSTFFSKFLTPISSGNYDANTGCITFTTVSGASFNVCGFNSGGVSAFTYDNNNNLTISRNGLSDLRVNMSQLSGLTINGNLRVTGTISGGTLYGDATNLTGLVGSGSYDNNTKLITFFRNDGPVAYTINLSSLDINDTYVTGGTLTNPTNNTNSGNINLRYNQDVVNGTYTLPYTDTFITGFTYNDNNTFTIVSNNGTKLNSTINIMSGLTVNGDVSGTTFYGDGTKLKGVINDVSFDTNTNTITLVRNGGNISITGITDGYVTGFTYSNNNITLTQNEGLSPLNVNISVMTGLTINGNLNVNGNTTLSGDTNQIGNFNVTGNTSTLGNTILNGNINVNGNTNLSGTTNQIGNFNLTGVTAFNGNFTIQNANGTNTGINVFDTSLIPPGTTVVHQFQSQGGVIAHLGDLSSGEPNSKGYIYMENNATPTVCTATNTYYKVSGVTSTIGQYLNLFTTGNTYNKLVYIYPSATGSSFTYLKYNISASISTVTGGGVDINLQLRKNNISVPITVSSITGGSTKPTTTTMTGIVSALNNDAFELYINCPKNATTSIIVSDLSISLFT